LTVFARAIHALSKLSDELILQPMADGVSSMKDIITIMICSLVCDRLIQTSQRAVVFYLQLNSFTTTLMVHRKN
jgi:hypothetical protein